MKKIDLVGKSKEELQLTLQELKEKLVQLKFSLAESKLKDFSQLGKLRRDIARVMTNLKNA